MSMGLGFFIYRIIITLSALYGLYSYKRLNKAYKALVFLIVLSCIKELVDKYVYNTFSGGNYLSHFLLTSALVLNLRIYLPQWAENTKLKRGAVLITMSFFILSILNMMYVQNIMVNPTNGLVLLCLQMVGFSLVSFKVIINSPADVAIYKKPLFWLSVSNLFFYTVIYLVFSFFHFFKGVGDVGNWIPVVATLSNYLLYIGYGIAIYVHKNKLNVQS